MDTVATTLVVKIPGKRERREQVWHTGHGPYGMDGAHHCKVQQFQSDKDKSVELGIGLRNKLLYIEKSK